MVSEANSVAVNSEKSQNHEANSTPWRQSLDEFLFAMFFDVFELPKSTLHYSFVKLIAEKGGLGRATALGLLVCYMTVLFFILYIPTYTRQILLNTVFMIYPAIKSFLLIKGGFEEENMDAIIKWMTYWILFSFVSSFSTLFECIAPI